LYDRRGTAWRPIGDLPRDRRSHRAYPRRAQAIFLTFLGGLGGWLMGLVLYRSVREHI